jgi:hypothetical protein
VSSAGAPVMYASFFLPVRMFVWAGSADGIETEKERLLSTRFDLEVESSPVSCDNSLIRQVAWRPIRLGTSSRTANSSPIAMPCGSADHE